MNIMADRLRYLQQIIDGFLQTNIPLILFDGTKTTPFFTFDDIGIYVFIPSLVRMFGISLEHAINYFFYSIIIASFTLGFIGFLLYYKSILTKSIACTGLVLLLYFIIKFSITDVYLAYLGSVLSVIPLLLYFIKHRPASWMHYLFIFISGALVGIFHYIRAYSSLASLVFILIVTASTQTLSLKNKTVLFAAILAGLFIPYCYFNQIIEKNKQYTRQHFTDADQVIHNHVFWHPIYLGFGFLQCLNEDNIQFNDNFGLEKARLCNPSVSFEKTKEYESIIKNETIKLLRRQPWFVLYTIFAKLGVLFMFLLIFSNFGLLAAVYAPKEWYLESAFLLSFCITALFPLIAVPYLGYSSGFITLATIYGIVSINHFLEQRGFATIKLWMKRLTMASI